MPRPFGTWAPATSMAELKARTPRPSHYRFRNIMSLRREAYYSPEAMAHFKDPQQLKDAVDITRRMMWSDRFWGEGVKKPHNWFLKFAIVDACVLFVVVMAINRYYGSFIPSTNPSYRKVVNKEWEEAINNSPWDHRSHVWSYCDVYACCLGDGIARGPRKFYIPA